MSLAPISLSSAAPVVAEAPKPAAPPVAAQAVAASLQPDTVNISAAGRTAVSGGSDGDADAH